MMHQSPGITWYQQHLVAALRRRIAATEAALGNVFGFETIQRDATTLVRAHRWPNTMDHIPFDRVYNYRVLAPTTPDPILTHLQASKVDAVVEVLAGAPHDPTAAHLHREQFAPSWEISWLQVRTDQCTAPLSVHIRVRKVGHHEMEHFAALFTEGYEYRDVQATYWHTFAQYGYTAPGFHCFVAEINGTPVGVGVLHIEGAVAFVDGAATLPSYRGQGAQKALLTARIRYARNHGCTYAFSRTRCGSISQRNMEQLGFVVIARSWAWRRIVGSIDPARCGAIPHDTDRRRAD
jgi:GNAT superfamily N-acetyltransferase